MGNNDDGSAEADAEKVKERDMKDRLDQEPWAFGQAYTPSAKAAIELRYQLLPYLYTTFWQYVQKGTPVIRSLSFYDQMDENTLDKEVEFMLGDHILAAPVIEPNVKKVKVYLPKGIWYDYWTGEKYKGGQSIKYKVSLETFPMFVKAGAAIPHYPVMQYTGEKKVDTLTLKVFTGTNENQLYEDAGEGYDYNQDKYSLRTFATSTNKGNLLIKQSQKGDYATDYGIIKLEIVGMSGAVKSCVVDGKTTDFKANNGNITLKVKAKFKALEIRI